ncbi:hypothetical protein LL912_24215 [Niabella sp. CC-SYL272]|uniref:hypothetical protein n=1 Tax=Niabella agricola TaxID=2891571 RepID=UPI001F413505|nr:hypothetical protein [Niabella agricola]MCF3111915.1 hypothetical protein [Niabella agricola]
MKRIYLILFLGLNLVWLVMACNKALTFPEGGSLPLPELEGATARLHWVGPRYKVAVQAAIKDGEGIQKVRMRNGEWLLDTVFDVSNQQVFSIRDSFLVPKDVNPTQHVLEFQITNSRGGLIKKYVTVEDLSSENLIPGYNPDELPPDIQVVKPTVTKFLGFSTAPIKVDVEATIKDLEIDNIELKLWGETADGQPVEFYEKIVPADDAAKKQYTLIKTFELPAGKPGLYQYVIRSTDASGNKKTVGGEVSVGYIDRLYLSDAQHAGEVTAQGYDQAGGCRGIGTIYSMKKQGTNTFLIDYYYPASGAENIRFIAFMGNDKPFNNTGGTQAGINYTLDGGNVIGSSSATPGTLTVNLQEAGFKLPATQKGYYHISVDMTKRTITATPYTPTLPVDAVKYPGWSDASPWPYLAVTGPTVAGSAGGWTEATTSPKLIRDPDNKYLFSGSFQTTGGSSNMSLNAPLAALSGDVWGKGWFRLAAARAAMKDDYSDLITTVGAVGASSGGANWGFSTSPAGTYKASYDLVLQRFRIVRTGN